jgi:hypothetical protein
LKTTGVIPRRIEFVLAALQVQTFRFPDLRYFISELCNPFLDWGLHEVGMETNLWTVYSSEMREVSTSQEVPKHLAVPVSESTCDPI